MLRVAIRVDASTQIGTGHVMRCLTLADALRKSGAHVRFICRHLPGHLHEVLAVHGHEAVIIGSSDAPLPGTVSSSPAGNLGESAHASWLAVTQARDAQDTQAALAGGTWDWLVVDHYALDVVWEKALRAAVGRLMVIDDLADREHDCDLLLDQNHYEELQSRYRNRVPAACTLLLGPRYALLREEFDALRQRARVRDGAVSRLLVFFGGVDAANHTGRTLEALSTMSLTEFAVDVVIGTGHPARSAVEAACARAGHACHVQTTVIGELMASADVAIGAGGVAVWERCCLGLPTLALTTAANQVRQLADAARAGLLCAPERVAESSDLIQIHLRALLENSALRHLLSHNAMQAVDAAGARRVAGAMTRAAIHVRLATADDAANMFQWRNDSSVREVSRSSRQIEWEEHRQWLAAALADPARIVLIGEQEDAPAGVVRFDIDHDEDAEVSIYLAPEKQSSGLGASLLHAAEQWLGAHRPQVRLISAYVHAGNERSRRLFEGCGYAARATTYVKRLH